MLDQPQLLSLSHILGKLLTISDSDFTSFLNSFEQDDLRAFTHGMCLFWSSWEHLEDALTSDLHAKFLKFLLRLCPRFNSSHSIRIREEKSLKAVIPPKRIIDALFDVDPLGLVLYLYRIWRTRAPESLTILRDELFPQALIEKLKKLQKEIGRDDEETAELLQWTTNLDPASNSLSRRETESILKRFEYDSDDDLVEEEENLNASADRAHSSPAAVDPIQKQLLATYTTNPALFSRTAATRQSSARKALCTTTKLSHEQLEGWAVMLERNPRKSRILQDFIINHSADTNKNA